MARTILSFLALRNVTRADGLFSSPMRLSSSAAAAAAAAAHFDLIPAAVSFGA
jgi:hypothetical protein